MHAATTSSHGNGGGGTARSRVHNSSKQPLDLEVGMIPLHLLLSHKTRCTSVIKQI